MAFKLKAVLTGQVRERCKLCYNIQTTSAVVRLLSGQYQRWATKSNVPCPAVCLFNLCVLLHNRSTHQEVLMHSMLSKRGARCTRYGQCT